MDSTVFITEVTDTHIKLNMSWKVMAAMRVSVEHVHVRVGEHVDICKWIFVDIPATDIWAEEGSQTCHQLYMCMCM